MATGIKTGGRQAGSQNKITATAKKMLADIVEAELNNLPALMQKLSDIERIQLLIKLLPYTVPKADNSTQQDNTDREIRVIRQDLISRIIQ